MLYDVIPSIHIPHAVARPSAVSTAERLVCDRGSGPPARLRTNDILVSAFVQRVPQRYRDQATYRVR